MGQLLRPDTKLSILYAIVLLALIFWLLSEVIDTINILGR